MRHFTRRLRLYGLTFCAVAALGLHATPLAAGEPAYDLEGVWAMRFDMPVSWRFNAGLERGHGILQLWALSQPLPASRPESLADNMQACGFAVPDTKALYIFGGENYRVRYHPEDFTDALVPPIAADWAVAQHDDVHATVTLSPTPFVFGIGLQAPGRDAWPSSHEALLPLLLPAGAATGFGMPSSCEGGQGFDLPPINPSRTSRAAKFFAASRIVLRAQGNVQHGDDKMLLTAQFAPVEGKYALQSSIVGCELTDGGTCSDADLALINAFQPGLRFAEDGRLHMVRLPAQSGCADVMAARFEP